jgi:hypothetical protein
VRHHRKKLHRILDQAQKDHRKMEPGRENELDELKVFLERYVSNSNHLRSR